MTRRLRDLGVLALAVMTGCTSVPEPTTADRQFVAKMIPHHVVGMELLEMATSRSDDVRLRRLVFEMTGYHHDDMATLSRLSFEWGVTAAETFPGDITDQVLDDLELQSGPEFDLAWLDAMIEHHQGALVIATTATKNATRGEVTEMADRTHRTQSDEITEMEGLLSTLCATAVNGSSATFCS